MIRDNKLKANERIDDLQIKDLKIIQNTEKFCFGMDAVLLAHFAAQDIKENMKVVDLGTGTGIIPLLIWAKAQPKKVMGLEIQGDMVEMAQRSVVLNGLEKDITILQGDIKEPPDDILPNYYDVVVTNPPYMINQGGLKNPRESKAIARHEILCTLEDIVKMARKILKPRGRLYMIHRSERLVDILYQMRAAGMEPKKLRMIHPAMDKGPNLVLIQGIKGSNPSLKIEKPLYVYQRDGDYTQEIYQIYQWERKKKE